MKDIKKECSVEHIKQNIIGTIKTLELESYDTHVNLDASTIRNYRSQLKWYHTKHKRILDAFLRYSFCLDLKLSDDTYDEWLKERRTLDYQIERYKRCFL